MRPIDADALIEFCAERWIPLNIDAVNMQPTIQPVATDTNVGDTISRQAAIDAIQAHKHNVLDAREYDEGVACGYAAAHNHICDVIAILPSAQPEPQEGHWIDKGWDGDWAWEIDGRGNCWRVIECSECRKGVSVESNYCPHCGAKMKGERQK